MVEGSGFSTSSPTHMIIWLFYFTHPSRCEVYLIVALIFLSLMAMFNIFSCACGPIVYLQKYGRSLSFKFFSHVLIELFTYCWNRALHIFWIHVWLQTDVFSQPTTCLWFLKMSFEVHIFNFNEVQFTSFSYMDCALGTVFLCLTWGHKDFSPMFYSWNVTVLALKI